jgi:uncharacterized membrane protein
MTDTKEYEIRTVEDFLAVPADKRDECLRDFKTWMEIKSKTGEIEAELSEGLGVPVAIRHNVFTWLDDGIAGVSQIRITTGDA